jgi:3-hydroxy-3-methylglutaryl CoA synthase
MTSILSFSGYVPRYRLARKAIAEANRWFAGGMGALAKGERAYANWDEDVITMAVAAGRNALADRNPPSEVWLASTTLPFADRQNAGVVAAAIGCGDQVGALDIGGSLKSATSGLLAAARATGEDHAILLATAEQRQFKAGSTGELTSGDAAAAVLIGPGDGVAEIVASAQSSVDFVDHYRASDKPFDYNWEERWVRDEGFSRLVPAVARDAINRAGLMPGDIDHFLLPAPSAATAKMVAKQIGIDEDGITDGLTETVGFSGSAHGLLMLVDVLERARPGERILLIGFGQGVDAIVIETKPALADFAPADPLSEQLARGIASDNYMRYLSINGHMEQEHGLRAELDLQTQPTIMYRNKNMLLGFVGGECSACGAVQFPKSPICVNPNCGAMNTQGDYRFADLPATLQSYTSDRLTYTPDPPARYGMVKYRDGGCLMMDITDACEDEVGAGKPVTMAFRIKADDERRGIKRYFWKAVPRLDGRGETA